MKTRSFSLLLALLSGVAMGCTVAPVEWWGFAWIALTPLWVLLYRSPVNPLGLGFAWGVGFHGVALFWLTGIHPMTWMGVPWLASLAIAIACWMAVTVWGAAWAALWAAIVSRYRGNNGLTRVLLGVAAWCLLDEIWQLTPLWWSSLAYTQSPHNLAILHLGQLSGTTAVTASVVAVNGCLAAAVLSEKRRQLAVMAAIATFSISHLLGFYFYSRPLNDSPNLAFRAGIIQGNVPNEIKLYREGFIRALEGYTRGYETLAEAGVDAVLTPETALPDFWEADALSSNSPLAHLYQAIRRWEVTAWVGTFQGNLRRYSNSLLTVTGDGEVFSRYDKAILVPLGEYIPFESVLGSVVNRLSPLQAQMVPGAKNQVFDTPFGRAIVGICYESAFPEHFRRQAVRGGEFFLSAANNAHYAPSMPQQHHAQDVMRAIELDRWAIRATNTGYSAIVDPHGRTLWKSGFNVFATHAETVYRRQTRTLYVRWGDWLVWVLLGAAGLAVWRDFNS
ncbi:apolipoprotein N-acyltransferase [Baaleninema simplex]|uniref:apolipoprotein N-acyltransferase n=1 Tax=Baaleninema simplex TaxID=2862350 RepID=UPI00034D9DF8